MEINSSSSPPSYWTQPSISSATMPPRRRSSSPVLTPPILIILLPIITFLFLLFAIPPVLTFASHIFRPIVVKKSWDLLNIFLVLFAILCGIFAKRNDESGNNDDVVPDGNGATGGEELVNPQRWYGFSDDRRGERIFDTVGRSPERGGLRRLRRSSSSYPDLRQESLRENGDDQQRFQFRFFDDFEISKYRASAASFDHHRPRRREDDDGEPKEIQVDTFVVQPPPPPTSPSPSPSTPPPPPPPPPAGRQKPRRTYRDVGERKEKAEKKDDSDDIDKFQKVRSPPPKPPPPPPRPPQSPARISPTQKHGKLERRKSNVKKEIAMALTSLYSQRKRKKKQKIASSGGQEAATGSPPEQTRFPPPSPPPPPPPLPPPPSSVFHTLFKKGRIKRIHTVPPPPPPPPPPPSQSSKHEKRSLPPPAMPTLPPPAPTNGRRPPLPVRSVNFFEESVNNGSQSPLIPVPPPPPPFKVSGFKFVVRGDYVRIWSAQSSRCGSPERDDVDGSSTKVGPETVNVVDGGDGVVAGSVTCPSPDVNCKADNFIARLYDGWRLEKINSLREKRKEI